MMISRLAKRLTNGTNVKRIGFNTMRSYSSSYFKNKFDAHQTTMTTSKIINPSDAGTNTWEGEPEEVVETVIFNETIRVFPASENKRSLDTGSAEEEEKQQSNL